jgi:SAM-dependent methyltransferase
MLSGIFKPSAIKSRIRETEDWWFDKTRNIQTRGNASPQATDVIGDTTGSEIYAPVRVTNARAALRDLPITAPSQYTFLDLGSGKGRMLFVAAELPFRKIQGVEFSTDLHREAQTNIQTFRHHTRRCAAIESINANAADFAFPEDSLVLYLFNPFGPAVMTPMLRNLERSIAQHPRHVVVLLLWPVNSSVVAELPCMTIYKQTRRHHIYQTAIATPHPHPSFPPAAHPYPPAHTSPPTASPHSS